MVAGCLGCGAVRQDGEVSAEGGECAAKDGVGAHGHLLGALKLGFNPAC